MPNPRLSVVVGRFQTPTLHQGHIKLLEEAKASGDSVLILLGVTAATGTDRNPLDFKTRRALLWRNGVVNPLAIEPLHDHPSDLIWSQNLDAIINNLGYEEAIILGGRENSIEGYYHGKHQLKIIDAAGLHTATQIRREVAETYEPTVEGAKAVITHIEKRYPIVYPTVDVAIYRLDDYGNVSDVLMGKKGDFYNFIGGFVDPSDTSLEAAAVRETKEETGFDLEDSKLFTNLNFEFSTKVKDRRYESTKDSIMTVFHSVMAKTSSLPDPDKISDKEFSEFTWISLERDSINLISYAHKDLFREFLDLVCAK